MLKQVQHDGRRRTLSLPPEKSSEQPINWRFSWPKWQHLIGPTHSVSMIS